MNGRTVLKRAVRRGADLALARPLGSVVRVRTAAPELVLTFDDGPDPEMTPRLLEVLAAHDARATFFVLLGRARRHRELLSAIGEAGHEIALHGPDHSRLTERPASEVRATLAAGRRELEQLCGRRVRWFRPPYGAQTPLTLWAASSVGLTTVLWDSSTLDWKDVPDAERLARVRSHARAGSILLAHDGRAGAQDGVRDDDSQVSVDKPALLRAVLDELRGRGLSVVSLEQALARGRVDRRVVFSR